jgi:hypothetical protein
MQKISVAESTASSVRDAQDEAIASIGDRLPSPAVLSWYDSETNAFAPDIPGGDPKGRWHDYGESLGGQYEVEVGGRFRFIIADASAFTEPHVRFVNLTDRSGRQYLCLEASCQEANRRPLDEVYAVPGGKGAG